MNAVQAERPEDRLNPPSAIKGSVCAFILSCLAHAGVFAWFVCGPFWNAPVSQGDAAVEPIFVSLITLPGPERAVPEELKSVPISAVEPAAGAAAYNGPAPDKSPQADKTETPAPRKNPSAPALPSGQARPVRQQAAIATAGTAAGDISYHDTIRAWLEKHKTYPKRARLKGVEGNVTVSFTFDRDGRVVSKRLVASSGHAILDQAALDSVDAASPLPRMPATLPHNQMTLKVPFGFYLM